MENLMHDKQAYTVECKLNITELLKIQVYTLMPMMRYLQEECGIQNIDMGINISESAFRTHVLGMRVEDKSGVSENVLDLLGLVIEDATNREAPDIISDVFLGTIALCTLDSDIQDEFLNGISYGRYKILMQKYSVLTTDRLAQCKDYVLQLTRSFGDKLLDLATVFSEYSRLQFTLDRILYVLEIGYARVGVDPDVVMRIVTEHLLLHECEGLSNICNVRFVQNSLELIWDNTRRVFHDDATWYNVALHGNSVIFKMINGG